jgi:DNA-directed RNA polymerase specialized sigma24 family protein
MPALTRVVSELHRLAQPGPSDAELLDRFIRCRDEAAFTAIVERHGPMVLRLCRRVLGNAHAAEDALQATFLVLARKAGKLPRPAGLASWLYAVGQRVALKAQHADRRLRRYTMSAEPCAATADPRPR